MGIFFLFNTNKNSHGWGANVIPLPTNDGFRSQMDFHKMKQ